MKRVMSIILCLIMLFVMAAVPALAADDEWEWVEILKEDFGSYAEKFSFDVDKDKAITYPNAKVYAYNRTSPYSVTNSVGAYEGNNALKISRTSNSGDSRILFELDGHLTGQIEISYKMLVTEMKDKVVNVEVFGEDASGALDTANLITGTYIESSKLYTGYNKNKKYQNNNVSWTANDWLSVRYEINTATGDVIADYSCNGFSFRKTLSGVGPLLNVAGFSVRLGTADTLESLYIDDISVKHYEMPAFEEPEFDFSYISNESINGVTSPLNLIDEFTDDEERLWYITWISDNNEVINAETGKVTAGSIDERVKLTAIFTNSGSGGETEISFSKSFSVKVLAAGTYHIKEGFAAEDDYSGHNAIAQYKGDGDAIWGVANNYNYEDTSNETTAMNANIATDPENPQDKVLKLYRSATAARPTAQRVWTQLISDATKLNGKVYVGMRVLREKSATPTVIWAYGAPETDETTTRLMSFQFNTDDTISYTYDTAVSSKKTSTIKAPSGKWFDLTIELDMKNDCYNLYLDGESIVTDTPAIAASESGFGGLMFDLDRNGYSAESAVYFDDITVRTTDGLPYSIAGYNFTDASGKYPTKSMVEGGILKSVKMRKLSTVDSGTEPTLYVCFFKDELLYDVISAPIDEDDALGGFDVTLNKPLPENPLEYEVKVFVFSKDLVPLMNASTYVPYTANPTIFVAGDSIAKSYSISEYPMTGYAQVLSENFDANINIENHAEGSRSSRSFIEEGRLSKILDNMYYGDYLFIQFGHNDDKTDRDRYTDPEGDKNTEGSFKYYLMQYIDGARAKGATPVLITPPGDNSFNDNGELHDKYLIKYVEPMRELAQEEGILLVDLYAYWKEFVDNRPEVEGNKIDSKNYYMYLYVDDCRFVDDEAFKASKYHEDNITTENMHKSLFSHYFDDDTTRFVHVDGTHFNAYTARIAAKLIAERLKELNIGLSDNIVDVGEIVWPWNGYESFGTKAYERN